MRVVLNSGTVLADSELDLAGSGFRINGQDVLDIEGFIRATDIKVFDRGNFVNRFAWTTVRQHGSVLAAVKFCLEHRQSLPGVADLTFTFTEGSATLTAIIRGVGMGPAEAFYRGSTSNVRYSATGPKFESINISDTGLIPATLDGGEAGSSYGAVYDAGNAADGVPQYFEHQFDGGIAA